jgi:hypothetical protein
MIAEAVTRIQEIEQSLTEKTRPQLQIRLSIRACLKELRDIGGHRQQARVNPDGALQQVI